MCTGKRPETHGCDDSVHTGRAHVATITKLTSECRSRRRADPTTFGDLIDLHLADMAEVGKPPRRSKAICLDALKAKLGKTRIADLIGGPTAPTSGCAVTGLAGTMDLC